MKAKTLVFLLFFAVIVNSYAQQDNDEQIMKKQIIVCFV